MQALWEQDSETAPEAGTEANYVQYPPFAPPLPQAQNIEGVDGPDSTVAISSDIPHEAEEALNARDTTALDDAVLDARVDARVSF